MILFMSVFLCFKRDYIDNILNEPVSIIFTLSPLDKVVFNTENHVLEVVNLNDIEKEYLQTYITYAFLRKKHKKYNIEFDNQFARVDRFDKARLVNSNINATTFDIVREENGYTIRADGFCLTRADDNFVLKLERCACKDCTHSCQLFDFVALDRRFHNKGLEDNQDSQSDVLDFSKINESDFDLVGKFKNTIYDKPFVNSLRYFYNAAACEMYKNEENVKNRITNQIIENCQH
ncbi:hypothetical protein COBT_000728 [Conglomerata obtusa]